MMMMKFNAEKGPPPISTKFSNAMATSACCALYDWAMPVHVTLLIFALLVSTNAAGGLV